MNFIRSCILHGSSLIRSVTINSIYVARQNSFIGHNALFAVMLVLGLGLKPKMFGPGFESQILGLGLASSGLVNI
jgi:hypothetical protein